MFLISDSQNKYILVCMAPHVLHGVTEPNIVDPGLLV